MKVKKGWRTVAILGIIALAITLLVTITNHYYGWLDYIIQVFTPTEVALPHLAAIFAPFRFVVPLVLGV